MVRHFKFVNMCICFNKKHVLQADRSDFVRSIKSWTRAIGYDGSDGNCTINNCLIIFVWIVVHFEIAYNHFMPWVTAKRK